MTAFDALRARIDAASAAIAPRSSPDRRRSAHRHRLGIGPIVTDNHEVDPRRSFGSVGEFMRAV